MNPHTVKGLALFLLAVTLTTTHAADGNPDLNSRVKALEEKVAQLAKQAPPRWATGDYQRLRTAIFAFGREKLEAHKLTEKLTPEQAAQIEKYEQLSLQLLRWPLRSPVRPVRTSLPPPLPPRDLSAGQAPKLAAATPPANPALNDSDTEREALTQRVAEAKAPVAAIIDRRNQVNMRHNTNEFLEQLIAEHVKDRFDLGVNADSRSAYDRTILYRTSVNAPDLTDELLKFLREREQAKPAGNPAGPAK